MRKDLMDTIEQIHLYETPFGLSVMATAMAGIMPVRREPTFNRRKLPEKPKPKRDIRFEMCVLMRGGILMLNRVARFNDAAHPWGQIPKLMGWVPGEQPADEPILPPTQTEVETPAPELVAV